MQSRAPQGNVVMRRLKGAREPWRLIPTMSAWVAGGKVGGAILRNSDHGRGAGGEAGWGQGVKIMSSLPLALEKGRESQGLEPAGFSRTYWNLGEA